MCIIGFNYNWITILDPAFLVLNTSHVALMYTYTTIVVL